MRFWLLWALIALGLTAPAGAQTLVIQPPPSERTPHTIEVTFGSSQLFNHQSILSKSGRVEREIIPVTSALLMWSGWPTRAFRWCRSSTCP